MKKMTKKWLKMAIKMSFSFAVIRYSKPNKYQTRNKTTNDQKKGLSNIIPRPYYAQKVTKGYKGQMDQQGGLKVYWLTYRQGLM